MWSVLDLKDGFHQIPMKVEDRHYTCMSTPLGVFQWRVMPMGLTNAPSIFQRVMEYVLTGHEHYCNPYIDDIIIGSTGETEMDLIKNHTEDVRRVFEILAKNQILVNPEKVKLFMREVEFCGHILKEVKRSPAPGKLMALQKWELPRVVTQLRGFLGLTNYYSGYVKGYAEMAGILTSKLQLSREDGKKGSQKPLKWTVEEVRAFETLKKTLAGELELFQIQPDKPFILRADSSKYACGAVLEQEFNNEFHPVAFFSRKLTKGQRNWSPREQETYAIVSALRKWAGVIAFQPVLVLTDHKALESWAKEHVDTPSGPAGRRARWHETLSKFQVEVKYVPGKEQNIPDAMSRYAYPASKALQDCSWHGSAQDSEEMKQIIQDEIKEERGEEDEIGEEPLGVNVGVNTRSKARMEAAKEHEKDGRPFNEKAKQRVENRTGEGAKEKSNNSTDPTPKPPEVFRFITEKPENKPKPKPKPKEKVVVVPTNPTQGNRPLFHFILPNEPIEKPKRTYIMDKSWKEEYEHCKTGGDIWKNVLEGEDKWPTGVKLFQGKMYRDEKLCVPNNLVFFGNGGIAFAWGSYGPKQTCERNEI